MTKTYPLEFNGIKIDPIIFTQGFVPSCNIDICSGQCCDWGVYMDRDFKQTILDNIDRIKTVMTDSQIKDESKWFENEINVDKDFSSGYSIGTEVYINSKGEEKCVFKDDNNYCSIQVASVKDDEHKWENKPTHCILYPLTIVDNVLMYDDEHSEWLDYCGKDCSHNFTQTVFEAMHEEIKYVLGEDCYNFLNDYFIKNYQKKYQINSK